MTTKARRDIFTPIYLENAWGGTESRSGKGSSLKRTAQLREWLPEFARDHRVTTLLDIPCGDRRWMRTVSLPGVKQWACDIVPQIIRDLRRRREPGVTYAVRDMVTDRLPCAGAILCRDALGHLSDDEVLRTIHNFAQSGARWLIASTSPDQTSNHDIATGLYRPINLCLDPFNLPPAKYLLDEKIVRFGKNVGKSMGLWDLRELRNEQA